MPDSHAKLSPSSSGRWLSCPGSVGLVATLPEGASQNDSWFASEGTQAHALGELEASLALGLITQRQYAGRYRKWLVATKKYPQANDEIIAEMMTHVIGYVTYIMQRRDAYPHSIVFLEKQVDTGVPRCWGTADVVIVSPVHVEIIDLKYGQGIPVKANKNSQLMLYGIGALEEYGDVLGDTETVHMTIYQPRLDSISTFDMVADDLRGWRDGIIPIAEDALAGSDKFGPSESACRFCPANGICRARVEYMTAIDFGVSPDQITMEEMAEILGRMNDIRNWCNAVEHTALDLAYSQSKSIPGWKVVLSGGRRKILDQEAAVQAFRDRGFGDNETTTTTIKGLGDLEKLVGKVTLPLILGDNLVKSPGKPSLVQEGDKRVSVNPEIQAAEDFSDDA